jgi:hypothetical protein
MSLSRTIQRNNIKRLAGLYKKHENRKVKKKEGKPIELKVNRFDIRLLLAKAFKGQIILLKVGEKVVIKDNKPVEKSA